MLETALWMLLSIVALFHPQSRTLLYPGKALVAWTEEERSIAIRWFTDIPIRQSLRYREHCFHYHPSRWRVIPAASEVFEKSKWMIWSRKHTVVLRGVLPHCDYEYQVGSGIVWSVSKKVRGRTPSYSSPSDSAPVRVIIFGDLGESPYSDITKAAIRNYLHNHLVDGLIHMGDIAYSLDERGSTVGDTFLDSLEEIADSYPYMVIPGNHEAAANFSQYKARFRMPITQANQGSNMFYSFNLGKAHFSLISTEVWAYNSLSAAQTLSQWFAYDLRTAQARRGDVPWIFAFGHKPLYCSVDWRRPLHEYKCNVNCWSEAESMRRHLEPLFEETSLDIYFTAHVHRYERQSPILSNETVPSEFDTPHLHVNPRAPLHLLVGTGGNNHGPNDVSTTPQLWNQFQSAASGFGVLTVFNATHLLWEQYDSARDARIDYVWVVKTF